tara:strand:+ start:1871 stop:2539 length:669 start_codon:yes stop_codon:yes gene_type:complete
MITEKEKSIYNSYLYASRKAKNKPVRLRQNFDNLEDKDEVSLKKLNLLLSKYSHINYSEFFIAPYKVYGSDNYFDLSFYNTRKAIKCYSLYCKDKEVRNPDSEDSINTLKDSLKFIFDFCNTNKITLAQYKNYTGDNNKGALPEPFVHLKNHKLNFYLLHALNVDSIIKEQHGTLTWMMSDFYELYNQTRAKFLSSKILKDKTKKGLKIIEQKLLKYSSKSL